MTKQETFDAVVQKLRAQGQKSRDGVRGCLYRGPNGLKCAAGHLIPDECYFPEMEGELVSHGIMADLMRFLGYDIGLVADLQTTHDDLEVCDWEGEFARIAAEHGLNYSPVALVGGAV